MKQNRLAFFILPREGKGSALFHSTLLGLFLMLTGCDKMLSPILDPIKSFGGSQSFQGRTYLVYGQSNATSDARNHAPISGDNVTVYDQSSDPQRNATLTTNATSSICWFIMGNMLYSEKKTSIRFFNESVGGTNSFQLAGAYFPRVLNTIKNNHVDAILWVQGEADSQNGITQANTYNNLKSMIQKTPGIPWYIALDSFGTPDPRLAEMQIINEGLAKMGPDVDAIRAIAGDTADNGIHLAGPGLDLFGQEWANIVGASY